MPAFETYLLLDALVGLAMLLFVPFGIRRGVAKEAFVSAGILLGAAVAAAWADRAGAELTRWTDFELGTARFLVAVAAIAGGALLLGYGGGAALGRVPQGVLARLAGGLLGALNAGLVLGLGFDLVERYLRPGRGFGAFDDGYLGWALARQFDWLLLATAGVLVLCVLAGIVVSSVRGRGRPPDGFGGEGPGGPVPPRQRPVRLARDADTGKYEPTGGGRGAGAESSGGRLGSGGAAAPTAPIFAPPGRSGAGEVAGDGGTWPRQAALDPADNGHVAAAPVADDWLRRAAAMTHPGEIDPPAPTGAASEGTLGSAPGPGPADRFGGFSDVRWRPGGDGPAAAGRNERAGTQRCPACGAAAGPTDEFCPECGTVL